MKNIVLVVLFFSIVPVSAQTVIDDILKQNRNMEQAYNSGQLEKIADYYTKDAAVVGPSTEVIGHSAVVAYWKGLEGKHVDWKLENIEIMPYREVAIQRGISHLRHYHNGKVVQSDVRFTLVWIREDGQWKISVDHYSPL